MSRLYMQLPIQKIIFICFLVLFSVSTSAQKKTIRTYYKDGNLKSKGQTYTYPIFYEDKRIPKSMPFANFDKKIKKWEYWYENGQLQRVEHYKLVKNRDFHNLPNGIWTYFTELGTKYKEEIYNNGVLTTTRKDVFRDSKYVGYVSLKAGVADTLINLPLTNGNNLIINSDFDLFYYKPVIITYHGDTKIEDWIPFWTTPGPYTPDYLSNFRYIDVFSYNYIFSMPLPEKFNYAGLALYKESDPYSEYIQGRLISPLLKGKKYCLRTSINFCSYSKYSVNRLAFNLSATPVFVDYKNESTFSPHVIFSKLPVENNHFTTLCDYFIADGGEQYVTVGRFAGAEDMNPILREKYLQGLFGLEKASYYIFDNIELFEIQDTSECRCKLETLPISPIEIKPKVPYETDLNKLKLGMPVILENVNFEFDKYNLLPSSESILTTLLNYLQENSELKISIEGHTDDIGTEQYNDVLSLNRAKSVYNWLIDKSIDSSRLSFTGFGKSRPIFNEKDEEHRALNRRVEVRIIEK